MSERDSILVGTDFGEIADHALELGDRLAVALRADLALVHVVPPRPFVLEPYALEPSAAVLDHARKGLAKRAENVQARVGTILLQGDPARALISAVEELGPRLVVLGTHARHGVLRLVLGSVAEAVIRRGDAPVVTVNPRAAPGAKHATRRGPVLVALDRDGIAEQTLSLGRLLANALGHELVLVHVDHLEPQLEWGDLTSGEFHTEVEDVERFLCREADAAGADRTILKTGDPATKLLEALRETRPSLAVIGTHGRRGIGRAVLGSVAERVLREAAVPVVSVHVRKPGRAAASSAA